MSKIEFLHGWTKDNFKLQGIHWSPKDKDTCVVCIHGMSGNIIENYFGEVLGDKLSENGYGFIYGHNRGYGHINDIKTSEIQKDGGNKTRRVGATYERFEESVFDVDLWIRKAEELGYKKIILMGHSLGCNKVVYYYSKLKPKNINSIILASLPDMVGSARVQSNYNEMLEEAKENVKNGEPRKLLSSILWDWYNISSQTFLDLLEDNCVGDTFPLMRKPEVFSELFQVDIPIFAFMGEYDDAITGSLEKDLSIIKDKAINCPKFDTQILALANHVYVNKENELADMILKWLNKK